VEVIEGDLLQPETLGPALDGIDAAYYLVHSMYAGRDFEELDRRAATHFAEAARGIGKIIYLGGLLPGGKRVSPHLRSRAEVGEILGREIPTTVFRAGPIIGSGSASFEMVRYLTERLPVMVAPKWMRNEVQPIGIRSVINYLLLALERDATGVIDVGADRLPFQRMLEVYAEVRRFRRHILRLPVLAPRLAARWVGLVTPIPNRLAVPLVEGIVTPVVADTTRAREVFPEIEPMPYRDSVELALWRMRRGEVETKWSGALGGGPTYELRDWEGIITEVRTTYVKAAPEHVFHVFSSLGGDRGWLAWNFLWRVRGWLDRMVGGPGLRRGRRDPEDLMPGETVDLWRVETVSYYTLLRLRAEMRLPGRAWLQWEVFPENGGTRLIQSALFMPRGLFGLIYWTLLYPIHGFIFSDLVEAIAREAESDASSHPFRAPGI
jgi:uncharacterized protein YbjT (DUF2867 family)